jgi:twinkle protein
LTDRRLSQKHEEYLDGRGIDPEQAAAMALYSARPAPRGDGEEGFKEPIPSPTGDILVWPYIENGQEVNAKFRAPGKRFYQRPNGKKTFCNSDAIDDPEVTSGRQPLVITEGEIDMATAIGDGHPWTVSVPDGAPADKDQFGREIPMKPDSELDPATDTKFAYVFHNWDRLAKVKRFILASDGDGPGLRLRDELARRLGKERCFFVEYPGEAVVPDAEGNLRPCKDLNEVHVFLGADTVRGVLQKAKPYPVAGLFGLDDYAERGELETFSLGFPSDLDKLVKLYRGAFVVVSGLPHSGKSAFVNQTIFNLAERYGWRTALATFEATVRPHIRDQFTGFFTRKPKRDWTATDRAYADDFIRKHVCFITDDPRPGAEDEDATIEWLVDRAAAAVIRFGIDLLVVDPWNELSHRRRPGEMRDEYTGRAIRALKRFGRQYDCAVIVVAHPTKEGGQSGETMTLYDISDGAMWANKAEIGIIVTRGSTPNAVGRSMSQINVRKIKFWETGELGETLLAFDVPSRQFATNQLDLLAQPNRAPHLRLIEGDEGWTSI